MNALLLAAVAQACEGIALSVGEAKVPCDSVWADKLRTEPCKEVSRVARNEAVRIALTEAGAYPSSEEIEAGVSRYLPSREQALKMLVEKNERQRRLHAAVVESRTDPLHDRDVWKRNLEGVMSYEAWVSFRTSVANGKMAQPAASVTLSERGYEAMRSDLRPWAIEAAFQQWVRGTWSEANRGHREPAWSPSLQDAFWTAFLKTHEVKIHMTVPCDPPGAIDFRSPTVNTPPAEQAATRPPGKDAQ